MTSHGILALLVLGANDDGAVARYEFDEGAGRPVGNFVHGAMVDRPCIRGVRVDGSER